MNAKAFPAVLAFTGILLGCSTPAPEQVVDVPPPEVQIDLPLEPAPSPDMVVGHECRLGTSCMELDPRPFEVCLVGTKHCADKIKEPIAVQTPRAPKTEPPDLQQISR